MHHEMFQELLVFAGLMATLGCLTRIILSVVGIVHRRRALPENLTARLDEIAERLTRLEHSTDATALEVERISEGQRFTTKLLSDRAQAAAPGAAEPGRGRIVTPH